MSSKKIVLNQEDISVIIEASYVQATSSTSALQLPPFAILGDLPRTPFQTTPGIHLHTSASHHELSHPSACDILTLVFLFYELFLTLINQAITALVNYSKKWRYIYLLNFLLFYSFLFL